MITVIRGPEDLAMSTEIITALGGVRLPLLALERARRYEQSSISEPAHRLAALVERTIGAIGGPLLQAKDESEVIARIDDMLESGAFGEALRRLEQGLRDLEFVVEQDDALVEIEEMAERAGDAEIARLVREAGDFAVTTAEAVRRLRHLGGGLLFIREADEREPRDPLTVIATAPAPVAELLLGSGRGGVAGLGVLYALPGIAAGEEDPVRVRALARIWRDGSYDGLRLIASIPLAGVPESAVPASDRLDLDAIARSVEASRERVAAMYAALERGERRVDDDLG